MSSRIRKYFEISKKEWNGMVVLVVLIFLIIISPYVYRHFHRDKPMDLTQFNKDLALIKAAKTKDGEVTYDDADTDLDKKETHPLMFAFNPNNLPDSLWLKLGLSERQVHIIKNYKLKGGHFYAKTDLQKVYSITAADYSRLEPYINIPDEKFSNKVEGIVLEINTADSTKLTEIKGIGPAFAERIIKYRNQLGGFYKKEQLMEVYGIDSAKYRAIANSISVNPKRVKKIAINKVGIDDLRPFPYLNFKQMNAILQYRKQHGDYTSINDLRNVAILDDEILRKITPYITYK
ncbi:helix-hairpin-helix domain-containing protein [uncultured Mucilaginibacter sp.]|uniref:helix-hairpin-helix domain-containing protein n=1 Tax=uncultured Mucilaginibacter sp. TaxID=797541 RepID=UPI0025FC5F98|nr:helix-hairpin-helix domain-containing protein [uncultured Mucilaginibacter sp.]